MTSKDWDVFDILFAREDSYTNLLHYLFENSKEFYNNVSEFIFGKPIKDLKFSTRKAFVLESGQKNIPDIIIYNQDCFVMIEVKVFAGEGCDQTERYKNSKETIKSKLKIKKDCVEKFYFLTIDGSNPESDSFMPLTWIKIGDLLPENQDESSLIGILILHLKRRIDSLKTPIIDSNDKWYDVVKTKYWGGAVGLYSALKLVPSFEKIPEKPGNYWAGYKQSKNQYTYSALFLPNDQWIGKKLEDSLCTKTNCFELHFEFEWNEENKTLQARLDYHLNPYKSNKDIEKMSKEEQNIATECNKFRLSVAKKAKVNWQKYAPLGWEDSFNSRLTKNIMQLVSKNIEIAPDETVAEVISKIEPFIAASQNFVKTEILPYHS